MGHVGGQGPGNPLGSGGEQAAPVATEQAAAYDPGEHTIAQVQAYVTDHPDQADAILAAEMDGKDRVTLVDWLDSL